MGRSFHRHAVHRAAPALVAALALAATIAAAPPKPPPGNLLNACVPVSGVVTSGQPEQQAFSALRRAGYRRVIDLRLAREDRGYDEPAAAKRAGLAYVNVPIDPVTLGDLEFTAVRVLLQDPKRGPVLVHCATANRVGAVLIPWLVLDRGRSEDEALAIAQRVGLHSEPMKQKALDYVRREKAGPGR
ncbi:MAG: protein tyrosine phosphatase family protein [Candidatus Eisenbacteria bacterium]|nr:protein tyrosine phosphatase family protein [Candidatus Eisenbacteria bacterium]